jgi:hypothetical protein
MAIVHRIAAPENVAITELARTLPDEVEAVAVRLH